MCILRIKYISKTKIVHTELLCNALFQKLPQMELNTNINEKKKYFLKNINFDGKKH